MKNSDIDSGSMLVKDPPIFISNISSLMSSAALLKTSISSAIFSKSSHDLNITNSSYFNKSLNDASTHDVPNSTIYMSLVAYALIFAIGFFGNALVILVAYCSRAQQNSTHYCLVNLSVADLLLIIVCMPSAILELFSKEVWYLGFFLCKIIPWLEHTVAQASILTIVSISIERSLAIASPLRAKRFFTSELLWLVVVLIWTISTLSSIPIMVATKYKLGYHKKLATNVTVCVVETAQAWQMVYLYISLFLFYLLPCVSLFLLYGNIVIIIKKRSKKAAGCAYARGSTASTAPHLRSRHEQSSIVNHHQGLKNDSLSVPVVHTFGGRLAINQNPSRPQQLYLEAIEDDDEDKTTNHHDQTSRKSSAKSFGKNWPSQRNEKDGTIHLPQINQKQIILLLVVMMMSIFICLLPYRVFSLWVARASRQKLEKLGVVSYYNIITICRVAFYTNSALNPIFYHIISTKFRAAFKRYFRFSFNTSLNSVAQKGSRKFTQPCRSITKDESALINAATKI